MTMKTSSKKWQKIRKIKGLRQFVTWYPRHVSENPGYEYRPDGKLLKKSASGRTLVSCTYFSDGSLESLTDASGKPMFYEYDWRGNLSAVKDGNGETLAEYAHTPGGRLKEIRHGNGLCTRYEYNTDGNMIHLHFQRENGETISDLWYEYDLNGNRTLKTGKCILSGDSLTDLAVSYRYDSMDRLTSESRDGEETAYSYDFCGNRLKKLDKNGTEEYHYNRKNQLICHFSEKEKTAYRYDLQGNLLEAAGAEGTAVFSYNAFHQQTAMTMPDGKHLENRYDAEYLRAGTVENGTVTTFSYHNGELLAESSPEGDTISRYIPGYGVAAGWNREKSGYHYYHLDEQNSTAYITGSSGEIKNRYEYDAFGVLHNSREEFHNRILYTGQQYDQTSGQYYLRARFYNPVIGRFVQEDVYRGDGLNLYAYCKNNPVVYYDPSGYGEEKCDKVGGNDSKSGSKTVPNPNGKKGGTAHQNTINSIEKTNANGKIQYERKYDTPNGYKQRRYADAVEIVDGEVTKIHQVGKVNKNGTPIMRESKAIDDIMNSSDYNGAPVYFWPYNNPQMGPIIYEY